MVRFSVGSESLVMVMVARGWHEVSDAPPPVGPGPLDREA